jgi:Domain of unknown function (DUF4105)
MDRIAEGIIPALMLVVAALVALWVAGAIYFDVCGASGRGRLLAAGWVLGVVVLFAVWRPLWQPFAALLGAAALFLAWWLRQRPSHDRDWDPAVAVLSRAVRDGDAVTIENLRNFDYCALDEFTPRYETRRFHLANLKGADIIFFTWGSPWMSHPVLVFNFGADGRVCMSIEVRYRKGQLYSLLRSLFRQQELIFLAAEERDVILRRTKYGRDQAAYLYRFTATTEELRATFLDYIEAINSIYEKPRWYHGLCANCTTMFYRLPHSRRRCDWRVLANGRLDKALYEDGRLDCTLPFPELRRSAYLNQVANSAPEDEFGDHIRRELERRRHER